MFEYFGIALMAIVFVGVAGFAVTFQLLTRWWLSEVGRNQMAFAACEAAILGLSLLGVVFGDFPGRRAAGFVLFIVLAFVAWWRWATLLKVQAEKRREAGTPPRGPVS